jgi:hypothetical protein
LARSRFDDFDLDDPMGVLVPVPAEAGRGEDGQCGQRVADHGAGRQPGIGLWRCLIALDLAAADASQGDHDRGDQQGDEKLTMHGREYTSRIRQIC